jgi:hypothetical protein
MKTALRTVLYGVAVWLIPFALGIALFPVVKPDSALFETLISVIASAAAGSMSLLYLRKLERPSLGAGALAGFAWALMGVALDAPFFIFGPFKMPIADYFADIGFAYLMVPIIAACVGAALKGR